MDYGRRGGFRREAQGWHKAAKWRLSLWCKGRDGEEQFYREAKRHNQDRCKEVKSAVNLLPTPGQTLAYFHILLLTFFFLPALSLSAKNMLEALWKSKGVAASSKRVLCPHWISPNLYRQN